MRRILPLPGGWNRHVRKSVLQICSLAWYTIISVRGWAAQSRSLRTRLLAEIQDLRRKLYLLIEELSPGKSPSLARGPGSSGGDAADSPIAGQAQPRSTS